MGNPQIAELIAKRLNTGLEHPGNPDANQPPMPILLPAFRTAGQAPEMVELAEKTAKLLGEAIVALIEGEGATKLVPKSQLQEWKGTLGSSDTVTVHCRCDRAFIHPLLKVDNRTHVVVDGPRLLAMLHQRTIACPHAVVSS